MKWWHHALIGTAVVAFIVWAIGFAAWYSPNVPTIIETTPIPNNIRASDAPPTTPPRDLKPFERPEYQNPELFTVWRANWSQDDSYARKLLVNAVFRGAEPTPAALKLAIEQTLRAVRNRISPNTGRNATHIFVWMHLTEEQAASDGITWAMMATWYAPQSGVSVKENPEFMTNSRQIAAKANEKPVRLRLTLQQRKAAYQEAYRAERNATRPYDAMPNTTDDHVWSQRETALKAAQQSVMDKYKLTRDEYWDLVGEGQDAGWPQ